MSENGIYLLNERRMYETMLRSLAALHDLSPREYVGMGCLLGCYIDALGVRTVKGKKATGKTFGDFVEANFQALAEELTAAAGEKGGKFLYREFRGGLVHWFFTRNHEFALAQDHELEGHFAGRRKRNGREYVMVNVDRLYREFVALVTRRLDSLPAET